MVATAGGIDVLGKPSHPGVPVTWGAIITADPDVILAMPCGYHREEVEHELAIIPFPDEWYSLRAVCNRQVFAMDASSHFSRPGPRILDGILEMAELFDRLNRERSRKAVTRVGSVADAAQVRRVR
jgi:iron complex transport system substrate-binding protein